MGLRAKGFLGLTVLQAGFVGKRVLGVNVSLRGSVFGDCCLYGDCCLFGDCCLVCLDVRDSLDETGFLSDFFADLEKQEKAHGGTGYPLIVWFHVKRFSIQCCQPQTEIITKNAFKSQEDSELTTTNCLKRGETRAPNFYRL